MKKTIKRASKQHLVTEALGGKYKLTITDIRNSPQSDCVFDHNGEFRGLQPVAPWTKDDELNVDDNDQGADLTSTSNPDELFGWMNSVVSKLDQSDLFDMVNDTATLTKKFDPARMKIQVFRGRFPTNIEYRPRVSVQLGRGVVTFKPGFYALHALNQALPLLRNGYNERAMQAIDQTNALYTDLTPEQFINTYVRSMEKAGRVSIREDEKKGSEKEVDVVTAKTAKTAKKADKEDSKKNESKEEEAKPPKAGDACTSCSEEKAKTPKAGDTCTSCGAVLGADEPGPKCADCDKKDKSLDESLPPFEVFLSELSDGVEPWTTFSTEEDYQNIVKTIAAQLRDTCGKFALSAENYDDLLESIAYKVLIWLYNGEMD